MAVVTKKTSGAPGPRMTRKEASDMKHRLEVAEQRLKDADTPRTKAQELFGGGFQERKTKNDYGWPTDRIERLMKAYGDQGAGVVATLATDGHGHPRASGMGPALATMCALQEPKLRQYAPWVNNTYGVEQFVKQFGFHPTGERTKAPLAENSGITGGYTIPPEFFNELLTIAAEDAVIEPRSKVIPMASRTVTWPMLDITTVQTAGTSPYFGGILAQWQPEAAIINETEPAFRQDEWTAWDLVLYTVSSAQLLMDNAIGLDALLTQLFSVALTWYKEWAFLNGTGTGSKMPMGILNAPATYVQTKNTSAKFLLTDVAAMMSRLHIRSWENSCWMMHQSVLPQLILMNDSTTSATVGNHLVWLPPFGNEKMGPAAMKMPMAFFNGLPLYFTEKLPYLQAGSLGSVVLADWSRYVIGNRLDIQIDVSTEFLFRTNQLAWRAICRCDGKPWLNSGITDASGFLSSPFIAFQA